MAGKRRAIELAIGEEDLVALRAIARSRTETGELGRAGAMLLAYREDPSFFAVGRMMGVHHQTVQRCVERASACGSLAALDDLPRPGREPQITAEPKAWVADLACRKAKELGFKRSSAPSLAICERKFESVTPTSRMPFGGGKTDRIRSRARPFADNAFFGRACVQSLTPRTGINVSPISSLRGRAAWAGSS